MIKQYRLRDYKFRLVLWVIALTVLGIMIIGSADSDVQSKQIIGLILGLIAMVIVSLIDYTWLLKFYWIFYFIDYIYAKLCFKFFGLLCFFQSFSYILYLLIIF